MISMRYGTVPIVHTVGGLRETVTAYDSETKEGNGFTFQSYNPWDMFDAIKRALAAYNDKENWKFVRKNAMHTDFSWNKSANEYLEMYKSIN